MSKRRSRLLSDLEITQTIFLGGQISHKHQEYKRMARMTPEFARVDYLFQHLDELLKLGPMEFCQKIIEMLGITEGLKGWSELTRLSMILGDTRTKLSIGKKWKEVLKRKAK